MPYHPQMPVPSPLVTEQSHAITSWIPALDGFRERITTALSLWCKVLFDFPFTLFNSPFTFHLLRYTTDFPVLTHHAFHFLNACLFPIDGFLASPLSHGGIFRGRPICSLSNGISWLLTHSFLNRFQGPCRLLTFWADLFMG